jgi:hypothetical protein
MHRETRAAETLSRAELSREPNRSATPARAAETLSRAELSREPKRSVTPAPLRAEPSPRPPSPEGEAALVARTRSLSEPAREGTGPAVARRPLRIERSSDADRSVTAPGSRGSAPPAFARPRHADPATAGHVKLSEAARSLDRSPVRLRRLSRTVEPHPDRQGGIAAGAVESGSASGSAGGDVAGANGASGRLIARTAERVAEPGAGGATDGARLAALIGGSLVDAPDGRASVAFQSGGQPLSRSAPATRTATALRALPEPAPETASIDVDDLYDQIAARLRRELLLDRERAGELP